MAGKSLKQKVAQGLQDDESRRGRERALGVIRGSMKKMTPRYPQLSERIRSIKACSIQNLDYLLEKATSSLKDKGFSVFVAPTPRAALEYITGIVSNCLIVKSKSNAAKEIGLVEALLERDNRVVETDLGDRIVQLSNTRPSHSLAPAIHMTVERVAEIFSENTGQPLPADAEALVAAARESLRTYLVTADVGLSGANAVAADTGSIVVMENEGNIRAVTSLPRVHIAVAGIEKIVPTLEDALTVVRAASVFGVGQDFGTYASVISGPARVLDFGGEEFLSGSGPREVHLILLEHSRREAIAGGCAESLYCINCGSCLNFCPVYREVGDQYGDKYLGGRGVITAAFQKGLEGAENSGLSLCLNCQSCVEACPSRINTPAMINRLRSKIVETRGLPLLWGAAFRQVMAKEKNLEKLVGAGRKLQGLVFSRQEDGQKAKLPIGLDYRRLVPALAPRSFRASWPALVTPEHTKGLFASGGAGKKPRGRVAFFTGCLINYSYLSIGEAVLAVLGKEGIEAEIPPGQGCCGLLMYLNGDTVGAREAARANIASLGSSGAGSIVVACATCGSFFTHFMAELFPPGDPLARQAADIAARVQDISLYLSGLESYENELLPLELSVTYHEPCHLGRGQGVKEEPRLLLQSIPGLEFREMADAGNCCGFGGTCSLKQYELSERVRKHKLDSIKETGAQMVAAGCPGCVTHLLDGLCQEGMKVKARHPVELLAMSYGWKGRG